jgi:hypothetical protein
MAVCLSHHRAKGKCPKSETDGRTGANASSPVVMARMVMSSMMCAPVTVMPAVLAAPLLVVTAVVVPALSCRRQSGGRDKQCRKSNYRDFLYTHVNLPWRLGFKPLPARHPLHEDPIAPPVHWN